MPIAPNPPFDFDLSMPRVKTLDGPTTLLSGKAAFDALCASLDLAKINAPHDHDVLVHAFGIIVLEVRYHKPYTLIFIGVNANGHKTTVVSHFTQLVASIVCAPKPVDVPERRITGFYSAQVDS